MKKMWAFFISQFDSNKERTKSQREFSNLCAKKETNQFDQLRPLRSFHGNIFIGSKSLYNVIIYVELRILKHLNSMLKPYWHRWYHHYQHYYVHHQCPLSSLPPPSLPASHNIILPLSPSHYDHYYCYC